VRHLIEGFRLAQNRCETIINQHLFAPQTLISEDQKPTNHWMEAIANTCLSSKVGGGPGSKELEHVSQLAITACEYGLGKNQNQPTSDSFKRNISLIRFFHLSGSVFQSHVIRGFIFQKVKKYSLIVYYCLAITYS
jgi:hypothetical protein